MSLTKSPPLPLPTFALAHVAAPVREGDIDAWGEWQARLDATAHERRMDPAIEAALLANDAIFRRRAAEQRER